MAECRADSRDGSNKTSRRKARALFPAWLSGAFGATRRPKGEAIMKDDFGHTAGWMGARAGTHSGRMASGTALGQREPEAITGTNRRNSLVKARSALNFLALAVLIGLGTGCGKDNPTTPPGPVTLQFDVYNHTQGYRSQFSKTVLSGDPLIIKVNELGVSDVDSKRIAVKEDNFGNHVIFSNTGEAAFTAPRQNMNYDVILFNSTNNAPYQWMDDKNSSLYQGTRNYTVYRRDFDGQTGPEDIWENVFDQLNAALDLGWVKLGSIYRQSSGDFSYGYGNSNGNIGWHAGSFITINPKQCSNELVMTMVGLEEAFENICNVDNIGGNSSLATIQTGGVLNPVGKDLFAYVFAKDSSK